MSESSEARTSIDEKFLGRRDLFGLEFKEGLVFCEVEDWELLQYRPFTGITSISSSSNSGDDTLEEQNDEILFLDKGTKKVLHGAIGIYPNSMRQYTRYPEGQARRGSWDNLTAPSANTGDDYGYVSGDDSPYGRPTDENEFFIPPNVSISFDFFNPDNRDRQPKLNLRFREYSVNVLNPAKGPDKNAIARVMRPGSPMPIAPVGTMKSKARFNAGETWGVDPIPKARARNIGGGN